MLRCYPFNVTEHEVGNAGANRNHWKQYEKEHPSQGSKLHIGDNRAEGTACCQCGDAEKKL
jgi:hypothetical protein